MVAVPTVGVEWWKEEVRAELWQELQDQMATLGKTLLNEIQQQLAQASFPHRVDEVVLWGAGSYWG